MYTDYLLYLNTLLNEERAQQIIMMFTVLIAIVIIVAAYELLKSKDKK